MKKSEEKKINNYNTWCVKYWNIGLPLPKKKNDCDLFYKNGSSYI